LTDREIEDKCGAMSFAGAGRKYELYLGRYSRQIAPRFLEFASVHSAPVLEIGCGPGCLTEVLAARCGAAAVAAVDVSEPFVNACRARVPGADVRIASADSLPFAGDTFEAALAQLVLPFLRDPERMVAELSRVVRTGGVAAACTFETREFALLRTFWEAAARFDPNVPGDARIPFRRLEALVDLWSRAGYGDVTTGVFDVEATYESFDDFWSPFAYGIGPAGGYLVVQPEERRAQIHDACLELLGRPAGPFSLPARVIAVRGVV
jgi:SAM-dependent methyltransferase